MATEQQQSMVRFDWASEDNWAHTVPHSGSLKRFALSGWRFPIRLERAMASVGWSEGDLAAASGVPKEVISRLLNARNRRISHENAGRIIHAFDFHPGWQYHLLAGLFSGRLPGDGSGWLEEDEIYTRELGSERLSSTDTGDHERWDKEFRRLVRLAARGSFVHPTLIHTEKARDDYIERVLRPFGFIYPTAAWLLAHWWFWIEIHEKKVITRLTKTPQQVVWNLYRLARRGQWSPHLPPRPPIVGLRSRPRRESPMLGWRPSVYGSRRPRPHWEHDAIVLWRAGRKWTGAEIKLDSAVLKLLNKAGRAPTKTLSREFHHSPR